MFVKAIFWFARKIVNFFLLGAESLTRNIFRKSFWVAVIVLVILSPLIYTVGYSIYTGIDPTTFPNLHPDILKANPKMSKEEKGAQLFSSIVYQLERELQSPFGWTPNDIFPLTAWLDNRTNRQRGVIFATRVLVNFFSLNIGKYGRADKEDENLKEARTKYFPFTESKWWFPASEEMYLEGINCIRNYKQDLEKGKTTYNIRSDDKYNVLLMITGEELLGPTLGLLIQTNQEVGFDELDDHVYYAQGVVLVLRDFLHTLVNLYPDIVEKGGEENIKIAFRDMDKIAKFDPLIVLRGDHDSLFADHRGKVARYLMNVRERLKDVAESMRR